MEIAIIGSDIQEVSTALSWQHCVETTELQHCWSSHLSTARMICFQQCGYDSQARRRSYALFSVPHTVAWREAQWTSSAEKHTAVQWLPAPRLRRRRVAMTCHIHLLHTGGRECYRHHAPDLRGGPTVGGGHHHSSGLLCAAAAGAPGGTLAGGAVCSIHWAHGGGLWRHVCAGGRANFARAGRCGPCCAFCECPSSKLTLVDRIKLGHAISSRQPGNVCLLFRLLVPQSCNPYSFS